MIKDGKTGFDFGKVIRIGKSNFETKKRIYCLDKGGYHYQFTNRKEADRKQRFFDNQGWVNSKVYEV